MSTLAERMAAANATNKEVASQGIDTSRPLLPEGEYMAEFANIGGFKKDSSLNWGRAAEGRKTAGQLWATAQTSWRLDSKAAATLLGVEKPMVFAENSLFLTLSPEEEATGLDFFKSNQLVDFVGALLWNNGSTKTGSKWSFDDFFIEALATLNTNIAETFSYDASMKTDKGDIVPENIQIAMLQMAGLNQLLQEWNCKANVFVVQADIVKDGKATGEKRNVVRSFKVFEQLED